MNKQAALEKIVKEIRNTYHPAAALRFPQKFRYELKEDFQKVKSLI